MTKSELCQSCGECCKIIVLPVKKTLKKSVMKEWLDARGCEIVSEDEDTFFVKMDFPCPHLNKKRLKNGTSIYSCDIYENRPEACKEFDGTKYDFLNCAWKDMEKSMNYIILLKKSFQTAAFRMNKQQEGSEEKASRKKEHEESGEEDTPHIARLKERSKRRRKEQEPPEQ